ncbi:MAG: NAD-dependent succinate-semialdehyde dehydrogenase [Armatimonadetes bacterium]|nr:NAD-dependent succinate-semialdehyde dehydrogenase [Armatimonadota bacterium]
MYIGGRWLDARSGRTLGILNPATEEVIQEVPYGSRDEVREAVEAAGAAFQTWSRTTAYERAAVLKKTADLVRERTEELALTLTREQGKTLFESRAEMMHSANNLEWMAEEAKRSYGRWIPQTLANKRHLTLQHPVGPVATIAPWNFPVLLQARKIAPALAAGCTVVARPASQTPLSTMLLFQCLEDAGAPAGVVNLVTGPPSEMTAEFMENPIIRKISFTGSTEVGKELMRQAAGQMKRVSLELGGHAPVVIFPDVNPEQAAKVTAIGKFRNNGQVCISPTRIYVHETIRKEFTEAAVEFSRNLKIGPGWEEGVDVGPLFERKSLDNTIGFIEDARTKGARVLAGGRRPDGFERGYWWEPTLLDQIEPSMRLTCEETFGPIMPIMGFDGVEEAIRRANHPTYGLAAYVMTNDLSTAIRMAEGLEYGIIGINDTVPATAQCPFGGMKESGFEREGGIEGLEPYLETKYVSIGL